MKRTARKRTRHRRRHTSRSRRRHHVHRGGWFRYNKQPTLSSEQCDVNNLSSLSKGSDALQKMHANYQQCCPKRMFGRENTSPYCKQLKRNFDALANAPSKVGYYGDETDPEVVEEMMAPEPEFQRTKPWYRFWGGKKTRRVRRRSD